MKELELREIFENYSKYLNEDIQIKGWVKTLRDMKKFGFIEVNDGTNFKNIQVVFDNKLDNFEDVKSINIGAAISVRGELVESPGGGQKFEIQSKEISVIGGSSPDFPVQKKKHSYEFLREIAHLRPRTNTFHAVFKIRNNLSFAVHRFFQKRNFVEVHTPLITGSDCEGAGEMFKVTTFDLKDVPKDSEGNIDYSEDFFAKETNLTVSGQLEIETYASAFRKVYNFCPAFRAENSNTPRHLAELWMIEPEVAFADLDDIMNLAEDMLKYIFDYVLKNSKDELEYLNKKANYDI
ncbi:MAG: asparagine--tRNA ligase, partial [Candidatus Mcinerneyibacterium aminivorans]